MIRQAKLFALAALLAGCGASKDSAGGASDAAGTDSGFETCAESVTTGRQAQLDLFLVVDSSGSMEATWPKMLFAFEKLFKNPAYDGIGIGLEFFPHVTDDDCGSGDFNDYRVPEIEVAQLPGSYDSVVTAMRNRLHRGFTPTCAALHGAYSYATAWKQANISHEVAMLFITDGQPTNPADQNCGAIGCTSGDVLDFLVPTAGGPVPIYFVGYPGATSLSDWASAAGTSPAFAISNTAPQELIDAIDQIRSASELPCVYELPSPATGDVDPNKVNVQFSPDGEEAQIIPKVTVCDGRGGWHYDDEKYPSRVELCPSTCDEVLAAGSDASLEIVTGCRSVIL